MRCAEAKLLIKDAITIEDFLVRYTSAEIKGNRCQCPIHNGQDMNMSFNDTSFKCFVCDEGGDVIALAEKVLGLNFMETIQVLNRDFSLNLPLGEANTQTNTNYKQKLNDIAEKRAEEKRKIDRENARYDALVGEYMRLDSNFYRYAPKSEDEPLHPKFVEACHKREYQKYKVNEML